MSRLGELTHYAEEQIVRPQIADQADQVLEVVDVVLADHVADPAPRMRHVAPAALLEQLAQKGDRPVPEFLAAHAGMHLRGTGIERERHAIQTAGDRRGRQTRRSMGPVGDQRTDQSGFLDARQDPRELGMRGRFTLARQLQHPGADPPQVARHIGDGRGIHRAPPPGVGALRRDRLRDAAPVGLAEGASQVAGVGDLEADGTGAHKWSPERHPGQTTDLRGFRVQRHARLRLPLAPGRPTFIERTIMHEGRPASQAGGRAGAEGASPP